MMVWETQRDSKGFKRLLSLDIISDITSIPVSDNTFDAVMCIEVFEHLPNL